MRKCLSFLAAAGAAILLAGCPVAPIETPPEDEDDGGVAQVDELFVDQGGGTYDFQTNDTAYWGTWGYTLWAIKGAAQTPFTEREVTVNKIEGDLSAGFGIVFCHYTHADPEVGETMLALMINTKQEYIVGEVCGPYFSEIKGWTHSDALRSGTNMENTIRVAWNTGEGRFDIYFNGSFADYFMDEEPPYHTEGADGYIVVISPKDDFPNTLVHVIFQEL